MTTPAISASPTYRWWLAATTADRYGGSVTTLALMLLAYAITGSTMLAGVIGTVRMLISFGLAPIGGLIVDSHDRRRLMLLRAGLSGAIWLLIAILVMFGSMPSALLLILVSLATAVGSLLGSAGEAALRSMTTPEQYASAMSIDQARDSSAELIGNPLAGLLYAIGAAFPFFFTVLGFVVMGTATSFLPPLQPRIDPKDDGGEAREPRWKRALGGFRWIAQRRQMLVLTMMSASSNFGVFLVFVLIELYLIRSGMTAALIGLMNTAEAVGVLLAAAVSKRLIAACPTGVLIIASTLWTVGSMAIALFSQGFWPLLIAHFLYALSVPAHAAALGGYLFGRLPEHMQGRVIAANTFAVGIPVALTGTLAGLLLAVADVRLGIAVGLTFMALPLPLILADRSIAAIPKPSQWDEGAEVASA